MTSMLVIIVNYRTASLTIDCLHSLADEAAQLPGLRAMVIDNDSGDGSAERIGEAVAERGWTWASVVASPDNLGFGAGNNLALRLALAGDAPPDLFWLLNPDTRVEPGAAAALLRFAQDHPHAGIIGTRLLEEDGSPWPYAFRFPTILSEVERGVQLGLVSRLLRNHVVARRMGAEPAPVDWVSGASCVVRRELVEAIGLFDEGFFLYYEETDFMLRARQAGWQSWYAPQASVLHLAGQSTKVTGSAAVARRVPGYWFESRQRYFRKHHGFGYTLLADLGWALSYLIWRASRLLRRSPAKEPPHLFLDFLRHSALGRWPGREVRSA